MKQSQNKTPIEKLTYPIQEFLHQQASGGILLNIATVIALAWANSPFAESYYHLWHTYIKIDVGGIGLNYSLHHWINDGLMVIFFFVVGLEIKREMLVGELSCRKKSCIANCCCLRWDDISLHLFTQCLTLAARVLQVGEYQWQQI